jgi:hypothetical protein
MHCPHRELERKLRIRREPDGGAPLLPAALGILHISPQTLKSTLPGGSISHRHDPEEIASP